MISVSPSAFNRIKELIKEEDVPSKGLRISVEAGGCSGLKYKYELTNEIGNDDDIIIESDNVSVFIDSMSAQFIENSVVNFVEDLSGSYFEVKNPNATSKCGCGSSFGI